MITLGILGESCVLIIEGVDWVNFKFRNFATIIPEIILIASRWGDQDDEII